MLNKQLKHDSNPASSFVGLGFLYKNIELPPETQRCSSLPQDIQFCSLNACLTFPTL